MPQQTPPANSLSPPCSWRDRGSVGGPQCALVFTPDTSSTELWIPWVARICRRDPRGRGRLPSIPCQGPRGINWSPLCPSPLLRCPRDLLVLARVRPVAGATAPSLCRPAKALVSSREAPPVHVGCAVASSRGTDAQEHGNSSPRICGPRNHVAESLSSQIRGKTTSPLSALLSSSCSALRIRFLDTKSW